MTTSNTEYHKLAWNISQNKDNLSRIELAAEIIDLIHQAQKEVEA